MLTAFRFANHSRLRCCVSVYSNQLSTKVSKAVKLNYDDSNKTEEYHKTSVELLPDRKLKPPLCTSVPKEALVQEWKEIPTPINWRNLPLLYSKLSKMRLTSLVVLTTIAGYTASIAPFHLDGFLCCCLGTALVSSAANAINQYHEVPFDAQMSRTKNRVLVTSQLTPLHALGFASAASLSGLLILYYGCNGLTAGLGASNLFLYTCVYTPLKRISILNTWVGSIVGAIPPMMGWASCSGGLEPGAWLLAAILYAWQFPHFNALSWNLRGDYSKAGYKMMSVENPDLCRRTALRYTISIIGLSALGPTCDVTNYVFLLQMLPLNIYFSYLAYKFYREADSASSRKLFKFSLLHLPLLISLILINKKQWFFEKEESVSNTKKDLPKAILATNDVSAVTNLKANSSTDTGAATNIVQVAKL